MLVEINNYLFIPITLSQVSPIPSTIVPVMSVVSLMKEERPVFTPEDISPKITPKKPWQKRNGRLMTFITNFIRVFIIIVLIINCL